MIGRRLLSILIFVLIALSIPLIAMQFTSDVKWGIMDFVIMGGLLFAVALLVDLFWRSLKNKRYKWVFIAMVIILFLLTWAELGVGLFGTPFAGN